MLSMVSVNWSDMGEIYVRSDEFEESGFPEIAWAMRWIASNQKCPSITDCNYVFDDEEERDEKPFYEWWRKGDTPDEIPTQYFDVMEPDFAGAYTASETIESAYARLIYAIIKVEFNSDIRISSLQP